MEATAAVITTSEQDNNKRFFGPQGIPAIRDSLAVFAGIYAMALPPKRVYQGRYHPPGVVSDAQNDFRTLCFARESRQKS
jgi:hypothetical protein